MPKRILSLALVLALVETFMIAPVYAEEAQ